MRKFFSFLMMALFSATMFATTYTAAGVPAALFGTEWDPTNEANDLFDNETTGHNFILNFENVALPAGDVLFKICEDHAWTNSYPGQNYRYTIEEAGIYAGAISFDSESKEVGFRIVKTGDADVLPAIALHGNFSGEWNDSEAFEAAENKETASLKLNLEKGNYEFGVKIAGTWTSNGVAFTRENAEAKVEAGSGNLTLAADAAGEYLFTWTFATSTLAITFPEKGDDPVEPEPELKDVVFLVNVPAGTENVFIAGNFNEWSFEQMAAVEGVENQFTITKQLASTEGLAYKYLAGPSWAYEERTAEGGAIADRSYAELDEVAQWLAVPTPESEKIDIVFTVNVPAGTENVFIAGNFNEWAIEQMAAVEGVENQFTITKKWGSKEGLEYKYLAGEGWDYVEVDAEGNERPNRAYAELDEVVKWLAVPQEEEEQPVETAKFYVTGDSALIADASVEAEAWAPNAIKSENDTLVLNLKGGVDYELTLTVDGTWETKKTFEDLTEVAEGLKDLGEFHNIGFQLAEDGEVKVIYTAELFKLIGNFVKEEAPVEPELKDVVFTVNVPAGTENVFIAGNFNEWAFEQMAAVEGVANQFTLTKQLASTEELAYKYLAGADWAYVEVAADGNHIGNRAYAELDEVAQWLAVPTPESEWIDIVFTVNVPEGTDSVFISGSFNKWGFDKLEAVEGVENQFTITKKWGSKEGLEYKYLAGPNWDYQEVDAAGEFIGNRAYAELDEVAKWLAVPQKEDETEPEVPAAKFYVTGDSALIADASVEAEAWAPNAIKSENDTLVLNLKKGVDYQLCVTVDGSWDTKKTFEDLTEVAEGLKDLGEFHNIGFQLAEDGEVKVIYTAELFKLIGNFVKEEAPVEPVEHTYTVAGSSIAIFGEAWNPELEANDMIKQVDGTFQFVKDSVALEAGSIMFKVVTDHSWANSYPAEDFELVIAETALYTVTITFNEETKEISAVAEKLESEEPIVIEHTYTVAGSSITAFGKAWDPALEANDMIKQEDGTYKWEKENLDLLAGEIMFKVCEDHAWGVSFPAENFILNIPEKAIYTITITFDPAAEENMIAAIATKTGESETPEPEAKFFLVGSFNEWSTSATEFIAGNGDTLSVAIELEAKSHYEFKVVKVVGEEVTWLGAGIPVDMEYGNSTDWELLGNANVGLKTTKAGEYLFIFVNDEKNHISVVIPEPDPYVPVLENGYYIVGSFNDWTPAAEYMFVRNEASEVEEYTVNVTLVEGDEFKAVLIENDEIIEWFPAEGDNYKIDANHAGAKTIYFRPAGNEEWGGHFFIEPNEAQGIDNAAINGKVVKEIRNGQLFIIKGEKMYNVQGQVVN